MGKPLFSLCPANGQKFADNRVSFWEVPLFFVPFRVNQNLGDAIMEKKFGLELKQKVGNMVVIEQHSTHVKHFTLHCQHCGMFMESSLMQIETGAVAWHDCRAEIRRKHPHFYHCWRKMWDRMRNPSCKDYPAYGGRGLGFDYDDLIEFYVDHISEYLDHVQYHGEKDTTIDRSNNNLGYIRGNTAWATREEQANNTSRTKCFIALDPLGNIHIAKGEKRFAREVGIHHFVIVDYFREKGSGQGWRFYRISQEDYVYWRSLVDNLLSKLYECSTFKLLEMLDDENVTDADNIYEALTNCALKRMMFRST